MRRALLVTLVLAACAGGRAAGPPPATPVAAEAAIAPLPYTVEQMRAAFPVGHEVRYRIEVAGEPPALMFWKVTAADDSTVTMDQQLTPEGGAPSPVGSQTSAWAELVQHAAFPAAKTTVRDASVEVPAGTFETTEYVVRDGDSVSTYHFDKRRAGPPVSMVVEQGGKVVRKMVLLSRN